MGWREAKRNTARDREREKDMSELGNRQYIEEITGRAPCTPNITDFFFFFEEGLEDAVLDLSHTLTYTCASLFSYTDTPPVSYRIKSLIQLMSMTRKSVPAVRERNHPGHRDTHSVFVYFLELYLLKFHQR